MSGENIGRQLIEHAVYAGLGREDVQERIQRYAQPYKELMAYYRCAMMESRRMLP